MRIAIVLPRYFDHPIGGYKVHYEYANRLQARGHEVSLIFPRTPLPRGGPFGPLKSRVWPWVVRARAGRRPLVGWFALHPGVRVRLVTDLRPQHLPAVDAVVATGWQTAEALLQTPPVGPRLFYTVYDYEYWIGAPPEMRARMAATYRAGLCMIATSPSVDAMIRENGGTPAAYIPCGIDLSCFGPDVPLDQRPWGRIGFPVREEAFKGTADAIEAVTQLRQRHGPDLDVCAFGPLAAPPGLPDWVRYQQRPTDSGLRAFYNSLSIFLFPSHAEGWGLPGMEALACGAALVAADNVGSRDYARDGETALVVPPRRPDLLADALGRLLADEPLRLRLAAAGHAAVQRFTWDRAVDAFEAVLTSHPPV